MVKIIADSTCDLSDATLKKIWYWYVAFIYSYGWKRIQGQVRSYSWGYF